MEKLRLYRQHHTGEFGLPGEQLSSHSLLRAADALAMAAQAPRRRLPTQPAPLASKPAYAAALSAAALSVRSQVNSGSSRPKCP
jgi:hypothetical protein